MIINEVQERNNKRIQELNKMGIENKAAPLVLDIVQINAEYNLIKYSKNRNIKMIQQAIILKLQEIAIRGSKAYTENIFSYNRLMCELNLRTAIERYISGCNTMEDIMVACEYNYFTKEGRQLYIEVDSFFPTKKTQAIQDLILNNLTMIFSADEKTILREISQLDLEKEAVSQK